MTEKKQQHKKKRGKIQHIRGSPKKRKIFGKAVFSSESIPGKMLADVKNLITDKASELKRADQKKLFLANFPYLMFAYFFNKIVWLYRVNTGATSWDKFMNTITYFELAFQNLWPSLNHIDLLCGIAGGVVVKLIIIYRTKNARKYRLGVEYGSARWGTEKDIRPYADPEFENNIILTETESLTMSSRPKNPKYARNKNILVIGGSGSGKTRFFVKPNIRLPIHVRCLLDEFANIGQIPKFEKLIATIRSREISASIILQSKSQLKAIYKDNADTIEGNCDTTLFLGGKEKTTLKEIAEILGKETIDLYNTSDTRGSQRSYGMNYQKTGKELMSQDEIAVMDGGKCILQVRGVRPFFSNKYDICKHKNYKYLSDYDKKNTFDIEKYLSTNLILKPEDEVELYQM